MRALLPLLLAAQGCTVLLAPGEEQCATDEDCGARGFVGAVCNASLCDQAPAGDPIWGCLGHVTEPVPDPTRKVTFSIIAAFTSHSPVTQATIDVCAKLDLDCASKDPNYPKGISPSADGTVTLTVIEGFDGFMRVTGPQIMDTRVFVGRPIVAPPSVKEVRLIQPSEYDALAAFAKLTVDPQRGTAILLANDCSGATASGVELACPTADASSQVFYLVNQFPTTPPTATHTDIDGYGGFFNLPVGPAVARTSRAADNVVIGESSFDVIANTISAVLISPTPQ